MSLQPPWCHPTQFFEFMFNLGYSCYILTIKVEVEEFLQKNINKREMTAPGYSFSEKNKTAILILTIFTFPEINCILNTHPTFFDMKKSK